MGLFRIFRVRRSKYKTVYDCESLEREIHMKKGSVPVWQCCLAVWISLNASNVLAQSSTTLPTVPEELRFPTTESSPPTVQLQATSSLAEEVVSVPVQFDLEGENLQVQSKNQRISIFARGVDLRMVLSHLAQESGVDIVVSEEVEAKITATLNDVPLWNALDAILKINGLEWAQTEDIVYVTKPVAGAGGDVQSRTVTGRKVQVFDLHHTAASEVLVVVEGLLSAGGSAFAHAVDKMSARQTRERIVVEDTPERIQAVATYLASVDNPPRQVLIEAHVLQVTLDNDQRHGVNLEGLARITNSRVNVRAQGFANGAASPGFMLGLEGNDLDAMLEALRSSSSVRTLAAPKVLVVNGQEARIQIGSKFGYFITTTTQTSTLQSVDFLDIGVVLQVEPTITRDGQVVLSVQPKVSGGRINSETGLPEEDTTEAQTTVILPDGKGMIIGGLIKESDDQQESWIPWLGERPFIGKLFRRSNNSSQRVEVIIALTPHIVPYCSPAVDQREYADYLEATRSEGIIGGGTTYLPIETTPQQMNRYSVEQSSQTLNGRQIESTNHMAPPIPVIESEKVINPFDSVP